MNSYQFKAIMNGLGIINDKLSSLEERTELPISDDKTYCLVCEEICNDTACPRCGSNSLEAESMGCQGDMLGQCELGCDGISDRGSCIDDRVRAGRVYSAEQCDIIDRTNKHVTDDMPPIPACKLCGYRPVFKDEPIHVCTPAVAQCGRPANLCTQCSPAMHEAMSMPDKKTGEKQCKYESDHSGGDVWSEDWHLLAMDMGLAISDMRLLRDQYWRRYLHHPSVDNVDRLTDSEVSSMLTIDYVRGNSNKPRREPVDMGDGKYGVADLKGLGGSTERRVGEHKANMGQWAWIDGYWQWVVADDIDDIAGTVRWVPGFGLVEDGLMHYAASNSSAPVQVVYCCNGAMYEARQ